MNINNIKNKIKTDPALIFKKPWYLLYIPIIAFTILKNRFIANEDRVFFVETSCNDFLIFNKNLGEEILNYNLSCIEKFEEFIPYLELRLKEENQEASIVYTSKVKEVLKENALAFVLLENHKALGYIFVQVKSTTISQLPMKLPLPGNIFSFIDLYIYNENRGKKFHELLYYVAIESMQRKGYSDFWCWLMEHNQRSIKAHVKIGIHQVTKIITRRSRFLMSKIITESKRIDLADLIKKS